MANFIPPGAYIPPGAKINFIPPGAKIKPSLSQNVSLNSRLYQVRSPVLTLTMQ
jgi:hypothetical protein